ncbi:hypothetical protein [Cellulomonas sp. HZM]|uniref:hypothetical protein n=1 Tax=Cellulomonas sp. HZM TaxID=1454010 RepID=UPI000A8081F5|nr:hypothetical protein [Cellulomonas sp. HZM]
MARAARVDVYEGAIAGAGTASGRRLVVGRWLRSRFGAFADVMVEDVTGRRTLFAPRPDVADEVAATYRFDDVLVVPVTVVTDERTRSWRVHAGPLRARLVVGGPTAVGRALAAVPRPIARSRWFVAAADPVARALLPGVRTRGSAGGGRTEWYAATGQRAVVDAEVSWDDEPCGALRPVLPATRFGFSSTPPRPCVTSVRTYLRVP